MCSDILQLFKIYRFWKLFGTTLYRNIPQQLLVFGLPQRLSMCSSKQYACDTKTIPHAHQIIIINASVSKRSHVSTNQEPSMGLAFVQMVLWSGGLYSWHCLSDQHHLGHATSERHHTTSTWGWVVLVRMSSKMRDRVSDASTRWFLHRSSRKFNACIF